jgi:hypothetical protein
MPLLGVATGRSDDEPARAGPCVTAAAKRTGPLSTSGVRSRRSGYRHTEGTNLPDDVEVIVGAKPYPLTRHDADWLVHRLRESHVDAADPNTDRAFALARALELILERDDEEPLELGLRQVEPVLRTMKDAALNPGLLRLQLALKRLRGADA